MFLHHQPVGRLGTGLPKNFGSSPGHVGRCQLLGSPRWYSNGGTPSSLDGLQWKIHQ